MEKVIPMLRVDNYDQAVDFYVKWLGFKIDWEKRPDEGSFKVQLSFRNEKIVLLLVQFAREQQSLGTWFMVDHFEKLIPYQKMLTMKRSPFPLPKLIKIPDVSDTYALILVDPFGNRIELREKK